MQNERTLVFAGEDELAAKELVKTLRARDIGGTLRSAYFFDGDEPCGRVIVMPDVPSFIAEKIKAVFGDKCEVRQAEPPKPSPLADLPMMTAPLPVPKRRGRPPKMRVTA